MRLYSLYVSLLLIAIAALKPAYALSTNYFYTPDNITSISGRVFADRDCPAHLLNMSVFGQSGNMESQAVTWQVGDFTGVYPSSPVDNYQRGINNNWYGSCAVQMCAAQMGAQVHTWSIPVRTNLANSQVKYKWNFSDNIQPWTHTDSVFVIAYYLKVPLAYVEGGACGYVYTSICLVDPNGNYFWIQPQIYDTRGIPSSEYIGWDTGTASAYVNTSYNNNSRYGSREPSSNWSTGTTWNSWRWYCFIINRTQLLNAVNDINNNYGVGLSTNPSDYRIVLATIQDEIYWPTGNGYLSMGASDLWIFENYNY